ncbi:glucosaminidase domain-containing protein [Ktedonospora formicarum]|uniref:Mannosyl-glycoprotein endo-beta-N-acetylglucosamidase-like domain-containing protein n=1 Tax=Ktedonospora formicarum TaxID=2778364 RepID=A0A8J3MQ30_9CHLR|nr:glucosaminidase domain-containing protein [Ktedonospora formicarum]GHO44442.1 hypothetical protein KSX_26050 [Ktedonospora formicarum]
MASGNYARKRASQTAEVTTTQIPLRATRNLPAVQPAAGPWDDEEVTTDIRPARTRTTAVTKRVQKPKARPLESRQISVRRRPKVIDEYAPHPLQRHRPWLNPLIYSSAIGLIFLAVLLWAGIAQRPGVPQLLPNYGGKVYDIQVGGNQATTWQTPKPIPTKVPTSKGPYSVLGKPTISASFINRVLANAGSPAAGKGQAMYDLGVKYGIDPVYALAFYQHESTFGTRGEAQATLSLGNLRCIPDRECIDQDRGGYAKFRSWEDGFESWYKLIRNLYIAQWGLNTIDKIIPRYAPSADNNNEQAYISSLKTAVNAWRAGKL